MVPITGKLSFWGFLCDNLGGRVISSIFIIIVYNMYDVEKLSDAQKPVPCLALDQEETKLDWVPPAYIIGMEETGK